MNNIKNEREFIRDLVKTFPTSKDEIMDEDYLGLLSLQIGCFRRFTQDAIDKNDMERVSMCFKFVDSNFEIVNSEIRNSLYVSYLGKLKINKGSKIEKLLTPKLKDAIEEVNDYYKSTSQNETVNKFLKDL